MYALGSSADYKERSKAYLLFAVIAVDVLLFRREAEGLLRFDRVDLLVGELKRELALQDEHILLRPLAMAATAVGTARLDVDAVDLDDMIVRNREAGPDAVLARDILRRRPAAVPA